VAINFKTLNALEGAVSRVIALHFMQM